MRGLAIQQFWPWSHLNRRLKVQRFSFVVGRIWNVLRSVSWNDAADGSGWRGYLPHTVLSGFGFLCFRRSRATASCRDCLQRHPLHYLHHHRLHIMDVIGVSVFLCCRLATCRRLLYSGATATERHEVTFLTFLITSIKFNFLAASWRHRFSSPS